MSKGKTLIFIHIGKAAGTTTKTIIGHQFQRDSIFNIDGSSPQNTEKSINEFKSLPEIDKAQIRLISGHMSFGLHEYLSQPSTYFTILRNPVERVISDYYHVLRTPAHFLHAEVTTKNMSLKDYVKCRMTWTWNGQIRLLMGTLGGSLPPSGSVFLSTDDLELAKANIRDHFMIVGLSERYDESLLLLKRAFGWRIRNILYRKQNIGTNRPPNDEIDSDTLKVIDSHNKLDIQLYEWAKQRFEEQIRKQGSSFRRELQTFRFTNSIFNGGVGLLRYGMTRVKAKSGNFK